MCNVMFWLCAIEPMSFGQISNVKRTHERRSYPFKDASITRIIIITSYFVSREEKWGQENLPRHTHTHAHSVSKIIISMQIVSIDLETTTSKFVEPALSFYLHIPSPIFSYPKFCVCMCEFFFLDTSFIR